MSKPRCGECKRVSWAGDRLAGRWLCPICGTSREQGIKDAVRILRNAARRKHNADIKDGLMHAAYLVGQMDTKDPDV